MDLPEESVQAINTAVDKAIAQTWDTYSELDQTAIRKAVARYGGMPHPPHVQWADDNLPTEVVYVNEPHLIGHSRSIQIPRMLNNPGMLAETGPTYELLQFVFDTWAFTVPVITDTYYDHETNILYLAAHKRVYRTQVWKPSPPKE